MTTDNKLNDTWDFWFHDPLDNKMIENSMLFLMRQNIEPLWEHKDNINGGCWSLKIQKGDIYNLWNSISISLLSENISNDENININGISISPKKNFCIIKIWTNKNMNDIKTLKPIKDISYNGIIFKPHHINN